MYAALNFTIGPKYGTSARTLSGFYRSGDLLLLISSTSNRFDVHVANISNFLVSNGVSLLGFTTYADISNVVTTLLSDFVNSATQSRLRLTAV